MSTPVHQKFQFEEKEWFTPDTYAENFKEPSEQPGVYIIVTFSSDLQRKEISYVGSSKNISQRYTNHPILRMLSVHNYVKFYFQERTDYIEREVSLIKSIRPVYNQQHNG